MKFKYLTLISLLALSACGDNDTKILKIIAPKGAPAVAFYNYAQDERFSTGDASVVRSMMTKKSEYTVVVVDTLSGVQAIQAGAPYELAATITFGNFFLAATGNDDDGVLNAGDRIVNFNRGATSDKLFHYIYGDVYDDSLIWVNDATTAKTYLETGTDLEGSPVDYVFIAQPAMFAAMKTNKKASMYHNIQTLYAEKTQGHRPIQASVFVKENLEDDVAEDFLLSLKNDIQAGIANPTLISAGMKLAGATDNDAVLKYGAAPMVAQAVTSQNNGMGLGFEIAENIKDEIDDFLNILGFGRTNEEIYFD
jgi:hypothetical protein